MSVVIEKGSDGGIRVGLGDGVERSGVVTGVMKVNMAGPPVVTQPKAAVARKKKAPSDEDVARVELSRRMLMGEVMLAESCGKRGCFGMPLMRQVS